MTSSKRLFVGSIPFNMGEGQLLSYFAPFGRIVFIRIVKDRLRKSRGMAYVEFDTEESAITAQKQLHNSEVEGRSIIVDFAKPDPLLTPEGQQRQLEGQRRRAFSSPPVAKPKNRKYKPRPAYASTPRPSGSDERGHLRQSVYNSRYHGSRPGRKFARRSLSKSRS